ncbi:hypothetical protein CXG81DRAFT_13846, partial [Caulochytrium protostelioides]
MAAWPADTSLQPESFNTDAISPSVFPDSEDLDGINPAAPEPVRLEKPQESRYASFSRRSLPRRRPSQRSHTSSGTPNVFQRKGSLLRQRSLYETAPQTWRIEPLRLGNIGLQNAVNAVRHRVGQRLWVGSLGTSTAGLASNVCDRIAKKLQRDFSCVPVYLADDEMDGHYNQFCKQVLWKPLHYQLAFHPSGSGIAGTTSGDKAWHHYIKVNRLFAETIAFHHRPGDVIWVNDYHLMLVPQFLRELIPDAQIGFFLHIPFPSSEIFRCLRTREQILRGMLGADLIGFQTYGYMRHFQMTCSRLLSLESTPKGIQTEMGLVSTGMFPIGINLDVLNEKRNQPAVLEEIANLRQRFTGLKILIGRDKNDYVKGVRQKLLAYERFLQDHPEWQGKVVLVQVSLSTVEANENETQVSNVIARIGLRFGTIDWRPVVYLHQDISFQHYLALLTVADACLITSLRDGMNLTSHEYIACQQATHNPLIISEFAGTYGNFGAALRVNPWHTREVANAIHEALTMSEEEKLSRWGELYRYVSTNTAQAFVEKFTNEIPRMHEENRHTLSGSAPLLRDEEVHDAYVNAHRRLFLLDWDSRSLAPSGSLDNMLGEITHGNGHHQDALFRALDRLAADPQNIVYVMSSNTKAELEVLLEVSPYIGLCAEHGAFVNVYSTSHDSWETMLNDMDFAWKRSVLDVLDFYSDRTPGSVTVERETGILWDYSNADPNWSQWQAKECMNHISNTLANSFPIHVLLGKRRLEVVPRNIDKGLAVRHILEHHHAGERKR